jgi:hypothetical protein
MAPFRKDPDQASRDQCLADAGVGAGNKDAARRCHGKWKGKGKGKRLVISDQRLVRKEQLDSGPTAATLYSHSNKEKVHCYSRRQRKSSNN